MGSELTLSLLVILFAVPAIAVLYQLTGSWRDRRRFPPPGRIVDGLHVLEMGHGTPTVLLEAGIASSVLSWSHIQPEVAKFTRVLSYDRAGLGWSRESNQPKTSFQLASELESLLRQTKVEPPFVMAAHSFGALVLAEYGRRNPEHLGGLVLVDPLRPIEWCPAREKNLTRLLTGVRLSRRGALLARFGVVRLSLALAMSGSRFLPMLTAKAASGAGGSSTIARLAHEVAKLPAQVRPLIAMHWRQPKCFEAMARHLESLPESCAYAKAHAAPVNAPVIVLRAQGEPAYPIDGPDIRQIEVPEAGHWIHLDQPQVVTAAIRELVERLRAASGTNA